MANWVVRRDIDFPYPLMARGHFFKNNTGYVNEKGGYELVLYTSPRRALLRRNDKIIFSKNENNDYKFVASCEVLSERLSTEMLVSVDKRLRKKLSIFEITKPEEYPEPRELSIFKYSLGSVYNYKHPELHFKMLLNNLSEQDFKTIENGVLFWPRTFVGFLLHSFSPVLVNDFEKLCLRHGIELKSQIVNYAEVANLIVKFFDTSHALLADLFNHLETLIQDFDKGDLQKINLSVISGTNKHSIRLQEYFSPSKHITTWLKQDEIQSMEIFFEKGLKQSDHLEYGKTWQPLI